MRERERKWFAVIFSTEYRPGKINTALTLEIAVGRSSIVLDSGSCGGKVYPSLLLPFIANFTRMSISGVIRVLYRVVQF